MLQPKTSGQFGIFHTQKYLTYMEHFLSYEGAVKFSFVWRILAANSNHFNRNEVIENPTQRFPQEDFVTVQVGHTNSQHYKKAIWFESERFFFYFLLSWSPSTFINI